MSELINNVKKRRDLLKHMIRQINDGEAPAAVRTQLVRMLGQVPYADVLMVEQELIGEGMKQKDVLRLCDLHTEALKGNIDQSGAKTAPSGHPVFVFRKENRALEWELASANKLYSEIADKKDKEDVTRLFMELHQRFNSLLDVEKHYLRKENLLFPYLEKHEITGPSTVMWNKHDLTRQYLKSAMEAFAAAQKINAGEAKSVIDLVLRPASESIEDMIYREEQILFPMSLDTLNDTEWYQISLQSLEIGFCLYDPQEKWRPEIRNLSQIAGKETKRIQLPSGSFTPEELTAVLNTIPFDLTFVDKDDTVRFFTQGRERIFSRSRAILGRKVQNCHPPSSVYIVEKILADFKAGKGDQARFWIDMKGRFIIIEYHAMRDAQGNYLGTLEVSQNLTEKRLLEGEQRLLSYIKEGEK
ncbi:MAG TPA: DUF438 domain-containing protein [Bacteroidetes bacterium]|nr:DUF438 domain-containing protein [Bacteroidota bacterium]